MPAYLIADTHITDPRTYDEYKRQVAPLMARFGGRFLVRGGAHEVLEGTWNPARIVVVEFPDMGTLRSWYSSPEYAPLLTMRRRAARGHSVNGNGAFLCPPSPMSSSD